jgi:hypothetical protein
MDASADFEEQGFVSIGSFSPPEAERLFAALAQADIEFRADFDDGVSGRFGLPGRGFGMRAQIGVSVDSEKVPQAEKIQRDLFGEFTP